MSDKICACLLALYPPQLRQKYGDEMLQLYRDRLRDERGLIPRLRLYWDLAVDALAGLPLAWQNACARAGAEAMAPSPDGVPSFRTLDTEPLRPGSILLGGTGSLAFLVAFVMVMGIPAPFRSPAVSAGRLSPVESVLERLNRAVLAGSDNLEIAPAEQERGAMQAPPSPADAAMSAGPDGRLDAAERDRVIHAVTANLDAHYFDRDRARKASQALLAGEKQGEYDAITDGASLAKRLTADVVSATADPHVAIEYSSRPIPDRPPGASAAVLEPYRAAMMQQNCTFERVAILPGNIGYVKLNSFPAPAICGAVADAAMDRLKQAGAIIFDLRDNTGGYPEMVAHLSAPLFSHSVPWYDPREIAGGDPPPLVPPPGSALANKPVYILTSSRTLSAAEQFTYNLKMLKRATVVGETTGGSAHAGTFHRIDDHFGMGIPQVRVRNPYGKPDWEGTGVEPDVKVSAADALATAQKLAFTSFKGR